MQDIKYSGHSIMCQFFSFIPRHLIDEVTKECSSDKYYKKMNTYNQLVFMLYGTITKTKSLNSICKNLSFLDGKLSHLGIQHLPASSTLSDANCNRNSEVFEKIYYALFDYYKEEIVGGFPVLDINGEVEGSKIKRFDSTTFTLFTDIVFKGAGRNPQTDKKKGGVKAQTLLSLESLIPEHIVLGAASKNDKDYLGQLKVSKGNVYLFDKGYVNYSVYQKWTEDGVYFVTRLNKNAKYRVIKEGIVDELDIKSGRGVIKDQEIEVDVKGSETALKLRIVTYKDPLSGKVLIFLTNHFGFKSETVCQLYKNRWSIEPFFKQLKQNFQLDHFYSDSEQGIKTQIWITLIANLVFSIIYQRNKQATSITEIVSMLCLNLGSYICFVTKLKNPIPSPKERNNKIVQLLIFENMKEGLFPKDKKCA